MWARLISTWTFLNIWGHFKCSDLCSVIYSESVTEPGLSARYQQPLNHWLQPSDHTTSPLASSPLLPLYHPGVSLGLVWLEYTHGMTNWSHPGLTGAVARDTYRVAQVGKTECPVPVYVVLDAWCVQVHTNTTTLLQGDKYSSIGFKIDTVPDVQAQRRFRFQLRELRSGHCTSQGSQISPFTLIMYFLILNQRLDKDWSDHCLVLCVLG